MTSNKLSVVVPVYNEEHALRSLVSDLSPHLDRVAGPGSWEFVFVDNGSKDGTAQVLDEIAQGGTPMVRHRLSNPDYGEALYHGLRESTGEYAFIINVEFWDALFLEWAWATRRDYDLIIGSKMADPALNQQPKCRRLLSWGLNAILHFFFGFVGTDTHGQKLLDLHALRGILENCVMRRGQFDTEFTIKAMRRGLRLAEAPVPIVETRPQRNLMLSKVRRNLVDIVRLRREIRKVPFEGAARYHMWSRSDLQKPAGGRTA